MCVGESVCEVCVCTYEMHVAGMMHTVACTCTHNCILLALSFSLGELQGF